MLNRIRQFFDQHLAAQPMARNQEQALRLAVGALLLEMTHMDNQRWPQECAARNGQWAMPRATSTR